MKINLRNYVLSVKNSIIKKGWHSKDSKTPTYLDAYSNLTESDEDFSEFFNWVSQLKSWNDVDYSIFLNQEITNKKMPIVASIVYLYLLDKKIISSPSHHVGKVGLHHGMRATLLSASSFDTMYGKRYRYTFQDKKKNIFVWFTSKDVEFENEFGVIGIVKNHSEFNNTKQTILTRCRIIK